MVPVIIAIAVTLVIVFPVAFLFGKKKEQSDAASKVGSAEERAREIINNAISTAEAKKKEAELEAKDEALRTKQELDREVKERRKEVQRYENRVLQKEETLDKKLEAVEKKEANFAVREAELDRRSEEIARLNQERVQELERISGLTSEQAKDFLLN